MSLDIHPDLPLETVPKQRPGYIVEKIPCCYLLKHEENDTVVKLNATGMMIWQTCTGEWTVGDIIDALREAYPDGAVSMDKDVFRALDNLQDEGVISLS
jgi:hypothetical protein